MNTIVKEIETHTGTRYEILRDITQDDVEILIHHQEEMTEFLKYRSSALASLRFRAKDVLVSLPEDARSTVCTSPMYRSDKDLYLNASFSVSRGVKYNGIRTEGKKIAKFNTTASEVNAEFDKTVDEKIVLSFAEINESLKERVDILNAKWEEHTLDVYTDLSRLKIESLDEDIDVEDIHGEIDSIEKKIETLQAQQSGMKELLRQKRVEGMIAWISKDKHDEEKTTDTIEPIGDKLIKALNEDDALKESSFSLLGQPGRRRKCHA